ncbi:MAG: hypothetical protein L0Y38_06375 [Methylococcaceae bacterium]|nr:hypothetical protein [Methylococcaceae bacterium]MCI0667279.1 hypothetical protein [Methylococcaceae bacterium]MCI0733433.1 hypothetical protein [Methylococcaceae bacterium]
MTPKKLLLCPWILTWLLTGCDAGGPDQAGRAQESTPQSVISGQPNRFDGVWEVIGRTGNEDGTNEPVCGHETGLGTITIDGSKITGNVTNKSGFEYTVEGTIDSSGEIEAMLIYSGYDAAELFGTFSAETNSAKGNWKDAVNACPGVWNATRTASTVTAPVKAGETRGNVPSEPEKSGKSG